jgi:hypothetical protein
MRKKEYHVTIFFKPNTHKPVKFRSVTNLEKCAAYCNKNFGIVYYMNLYDSITKNFIRRQWLIDFRK